MSMLKKVDGDIELYEPSNDLTHLIADGSGNVEIPKGKIKTGGSPVAIDFPSAGIFSETSGNLEYKTGGSGSDTFRVYDGANNNNTIFQANEGGNVEIPNGDLVQNSIVGKIVSNVDNANRTVYRINESGSNKWDIRYLNEDLTLRDSSASNILSFRQGGNVEIPNGGLTLSGGENIQLGAGTDIEAKSGNGNLLIYTAGNGNDRVEIFDTANNQEIIKANEGGNVEIPNGKIKLLGNEIDFGGNGHNRIQMTTTDTMTVVGQNGLNLKTYDGSNEINNVSLGDNGNVQIPNGTLSEKGDPVVSSSTGTSYDIQKNGTDGAGVINFRT